MSGRRGIFVAVAVLAALGLTRAAVSSPSPSPGVAPAASALRQAEDIARYTDSWVADTGFVPGVALAVVRGDEVLLSDGFGYRDLEAGLPMESDTRLYIASATKSFTAMAAALLDRDGWLELDAPLSDAITLGPGLPFEPEAILLRSLLDHTSGLSNGEVVWRTAFTGQHTHQLLIDLLVETEVGPRAFDYTNFGYVVAGLSMRERTGLTWQEQVRRRVLEPIGMVKTTPYVSDTADGNLARSYLTGDWEPAPLPMLKADSTMHAAGGLLSTADDLARWLLVMLNEGRIDGRQALPADVVREVVMPTATTDAEFYRFGRHGYGLGWYAGSYDGEAMVHHFGNFRGWRSHVSFLPDHGIGVAAIANENSAGYYAVDMLAAHAYDVLLGRPDLARRDAEREEELLADARRLREAVLEDRARRAQREASPAHPLSEYVGLYCAPLAGVLEVDLVDGRLRARVGVLRSSLEAATETAFRAELVPGSGEFLEFHDGSDGHVTSATLEGETWHRMIAGAGGCRPPT